MSTSQVFTSAYAIGTPTNGGSITLGAIRNSNVTVTETTTTTGTGDSIAILGDVGTPSTGPTNGDQISYGTNNSLAYYWGTATFGSVKGIIIYDPQGRNYFFAANSSALAGLQGAAAIASPGTNNWTLAGSTTPGAPTNIAVTDDAAPVTGSVANGGSTNDTTPTITGSSDGAGLTISIYNNGSLLGTTTSASDGNWTYTLSARSDGSNSITATATNPGLTAGVTSAASSAYAFKVDTAAPSAPTIGSALDDAGTVTGAILPGGVTDDTTPTLVVTLPGNAVAGDTVKILNGATQVAAHVLTAAEITAGKASITTSAVTGDGAKTLTLTVTDAAGNASAAGSFAYTVDTTPPAATTTIGLVADTGTAGDGISSNPALAGTSTSGVAGETITILDNGVVVGTATTGAGGAWTFANGAATDGAHAYTAAVTDAAGNRGTAAGTTPAGTTVDTQADTGVVVDLQNATVTANSASVDLTISGLDGGSRAVVTFQGVGGGSVVREFTANGAQSAEVSGLQGDVTATVNVFDVAGKLVQGAGETLAADPVCFYPGTLVATPAGEVAVETLRAGDLVLTADGRAAPIRWLGRQTVSTRFADPLRVLPVRIAAGALGENLPRRDLLVSADHALLLDGALAQAGALVNGTTIRREARVPEVFTYWHVELADHALVLAEGVAAESFIDNVARMAFDNWAEHGAAAEPAPIAELALPRAKSARQVPSATRRRLAERAATLAGGRTAAA